MQNELKKLIERLKEKNAEKTELQAQRNLEKVGRRTGHKNHRTRTQCFCGHA